MARNDSARRARCLNSRRGSFGENLPRWGLLGSSGSIGDCFDNAAMEPFWARMQVELLNTHKWAATIELAAAMADYIIDHFYNAERRHR